MNKRRIATVLILIALVLVLFYFFRPTGNDAGQKGESATTTQENPSEAVSDGEGTIFTCSGGQRIAASFTERGATVALPDGRRATLSKSVSASGEKYENENGSLVFWVKGDTAIVEENGKQTLSDCIAQRASGEDASQTKVIRGTIASIDREAVAYDGPTLVVVRTDGAEEVLAIPSMGILQCAARANITDVATLRVGDAIEARGSVGADGEVIPCESNDHFLRTK